MALALTESVKTNVLSQVRIIEASRVLQFEWPQERDQHDERRVDDNGTVRHPLPVLDLGDGSFILLDDSKQLRALTETGLPHLLVQVCTRKSIRVISPKLGLVSFGYEDLLRLVSKHPDQMAIGAPTEAIPTGYMSIPFEFPYRTPISFYLRNSTRVGCPLPMEYLFRSILEQGRYVPIVDRRQRADAVFRAVPHSGMLAMPSFTLEDIESAATSERLFPPNVIRLQSDSRVFNIDFPVSILRAEMPSEEKETFLRDLIVFREQSYRTTFFEGQVYILNR